MSLDSDGPRACRNRRRKSARLNFTEFAVLATPRFAPASRIRSILAPNDPADADPAVPGQTEIARSSGWARKPSQNRPAGDQPRIISALDARGDPDSAAVAALMRNREPAPSR